MTSLRTRQINGRRLAIREPYRSSAAIIQQPDGRQQAPAFSRR